MRSTIRRAAAGLIPALLLLTGCSAIGSRLDRLPADAAARGYVQLPRPVILPSSSLSSDCGPESVCAVLNYWGKAGEVRQVSRSMRDPRAAGVLTADIPLVALAHGLKATPVQGSVGRIKRAVDREIPPIIMVASGGGNYHFFVVTGYSDKEEKVVCEELEGAKRLIPYADLEECWEPAGHVMLELEPAVAVDDTKAGGVLESKGIYAEAAELYRRALKDDPEYYPARVGLANCLLGLGKAEDALAEYLRAYEANPADPKVLNNLANIYLDLGKEPVEAERLAERAVEAFERTFKTACEDRLKESSPAFQALRERDIGALERDLAHALGTLGQARVANGKHVLAISAWKASYDHFPLTEIDARARRLYEIGLAYRKSGMPAEGWSNLQQALRDVHDPKLREKIEAALKE